MIQNGSYIGTTSEETYLPHIQTTVEALLATDSQAETRAWRWERFALGLLMGFLALLSVVVWQLMHARTVQAFVQVVQLDESGQLIQQGIPVELLAYVPLDGQWMDMLGMWVRHTRWRGTDPILAKAQWSWAYRHTCGAARRLLQDLEDHERPFVTTKKLVTVTLKSVTKTPTPASYQVLWEETSTDPTSQTLTRTTWTGTFTVGRVAPATMTDALHNRLGLCVTSWDISAQPA